MTAAVRYKLSKSRIAEYLQCPKRLYLSVHFPELKQESAGMQARFNAGHEVGRIAQQLYPDGVMIGDERNDLRAALAQTRDVLRDHPDKPVFEATFQHGDMLIRADVLIPDGDAYRMVEVKSSTSVKDYYLPDCAMQSWVAENAGIRLGRIALMNVNSDFVYEQAGNYRGLLKETDISDAVQPFKREVPGWIASSQSVLAGEVPGVEVGAHCNSPFECPFYGHCSAGLPEYPVDLLPKNKARGTVDSLKAGGYEDLREVPAGVIAHSLLEKIRRVTVRGEAELDEAARSAMAILPYPRYYLDFETIQFTVPVWLGTSPFQQLPFQWSCHVEHADGELRHSEFLGLSGEPPMRAFAESLIHAMGNDGPVLVYNQGFEKGRMRELAQMFPDLAPSLLHIIERVVDLLPLAREHYYHPAMKGSWSIKAVLPCIAPDLDYGNLDEVQHGGAAQAAFMEAIAPETSSERREKLRQSLLEYCKLDTYAMVRLARFFEGRQ